MFINSLLKWHAKYPWGFATWKDRLTVKKGELRSNKKCSIKWCLLSGWRQLSDWVGEGEWTRIIGKDLIIWNSQMGSIARMERGNRWEDEKLLRRGNWQQGILLFASWGVFKDLIKSPGYYSSHFIYPLWITILGEQEAIAASLLFYFGRNLNINVRL